MLSHSCKPSVENKSFLCLQHSGMRSVLAPSRDSCTNWLWYSHLPCPYRLCVGDQKVRGVEYLQLFLKLRLLLSSKPCALPFPVLSHFLECRPHKRALFFLSELSESDQTFVRGYSLTCSLILHIHQHPKHKLQDLYFTCEASRWKMGSFWTGGYFLFPTEACSGCNSNEISCNK